MLFRALHDVSEGYYVDVGSQDPVADSVTCLFYGRGWRGINIEPVEHWYRRLCEDRPEDVNLNVAVGRDPGPVKLFEVLGSGLSTVDESLARRHELAGYALAERMVTCRRLDSILDEYCLGTIHFLKIDCEGAERSVLESIDLKRWRPWVILLEATEPNNQLPTHDKWEDLLLAGGYQFAYADGLNRFYAAREKHELLNAFRFPPNVFDRFVTRRESDAVDRVEHLGAELAQAAQRERSLEARASVLLEHLNAARGRLGGAEKRLSGLAGELQATLESLAASQRLHEQVSRDLASARDEIRWLEDMDRRRVNAETELALIKRSLPRRVTMPLRWIRPALARLYLAVGPRLQKLARWMTRIRWMRVLASRAIGRFPQAKHRIVAFLYRSPDASQRALKAAAERMSARAPASDALSKPAADAFNELKRYCQ